MISFENIEFGAQFLLLMFFDTLILKPICFISIFERVGRKKYIKFDNSTSSPNQGGLDSPFLLALTYTEYRYARLQDNKKISICSIFMIWNDILFQIFFEDLAEQEKAARLLNEPSPLVDYLSDDLHITSGNKKLKTIYDF